MICTSGSFPFSSISFSNSACFCLRIFTFSVKRNFYFSHSFFSSENFKSLAYQLLNSSFSILLPPKLYLVVFYQVILVNWTGLTCSDFKRPLEVLLGSACCIISHVHTPWEICNKCSSMILSIKDSVS